MNIPDTLTIERWLCRNKCGRLTANRGRLCKRCLDRIAPLPKEGRTHEAFTRDVIAGRTFAYRTPLPPGCA